MSNKKFGLFFFLILFIGFVGCEEPFIPNNVNGGNEIVVEGYVEAGENTSPAYVLLTKSFGFFTDLNPEEVSNSFINNAEVFVLTDDQKIQLQEICFEDLDPELAFQIAQQLGFVLNQNVPVNICLYVDVFDELDREFGQTYNLEILIEDQFITAVTTIPENNPLDSVWFEVPAGNATDSLAQMWIRILDPAGEDNYYRFQTAINDGAFNSQIPSSTNDATFDGKEFDFPLNRALDNSEELDLESFGLFTRGDTAKLKWMIIDEAHFNFWNTLDFAIQNQGPFSTYTRVDFNIQGENVIGIWGGYATNYYEKTVPPK